MVQLAHPYMTTGITIPLTTWTFVSKLMSLLFNILSRLLIAFLPRTKCLLILWLQSPSAVTLESKKIKSVTVSTFFPSICHEMMGPHAMILVFWKLSFKPASSLSSFTLIKRLLSSSSLVAIQFSSVQSLSRVWLFVTPWIAALQASLSITNSRSLLKPMSIESVMPSNHLLLCRPLFLLAPIRPNIRVFSNESALCIRWPKYWSFSFNISPSNVHRGLIYFRMDWLELPAVQGTLKSLFQHYIVQEHQIFITQLSSQSTSNIHTWLLEKP